MSHRWNPRLEDFIKIKDTKKFRKNYTSLLYFFNFVLLLALIFKFLPYIREDRSKFALFYTMIMFFVVIVPYVLFSNNKTKVKGANFIIRPGSLIRNYKLTGSTRYRRGDSLTLGEFFFQCMWFIFLFVFAIKVFFLH